MWLINTALRRPFTILVAVISIALGSVLAVMRMPVDIFPNLNLPVIYVAQPYGGMDPAQMESFLTSYYEYHFLYISGIEHVESRSIQNVALLKLFFHPGTDMGQALAQVISYVERSKAFMPPGTVNPFVMRFDSGRRQSRQGRIAALSIARVRRHQGQLRVRSINHRQEFDSGPRLRGRAGGAAHGADGVVLPARRAERVDRRDD